MPDRSRVDVIALLRQMGDWMRASGDSRRARAYRRASLEIGKIDDALFDRLARGGRLQDVSGVGPSIERTIARFVADGERPSFLAEEPPAPPQLDVPGSFRDAPFFSLPDLHVHTTWSDGTMTIEEVVQFAEEMGVPAVGVSDHSGSLRIAGGLKPDEVRAQWAEIDEIQARHPDVAILKGTECDILRDGSLDHPREILEGFDYVIGSLHSHLRLPEREQTERVLAALDDAHLTILGHPTTRVPGRREPASLDLAAVFAKAAENGVAMEVNGNPGRIDLDERLARRALDAGCFLSLASDGHSAREMLALEEARRMAKEAGATESDLANAAILHAASRARRRQRQRARAA